jgi:hypothetical protein
MEENMEFEYTVTKKREGDYLAKRILAIVGYIVFGLTFFIGLSLLHLYQCIAFIVLVEWILIFFTWRYVSIEYKYETLSGAIRFYTIYGGKNKKLLLDFRIKSFTEIVPFSDEISKRSFAKEIFCLSSMKAAPDRYCAIYKDSNGQDCVVHFEATQKTLKILKFYNSSTVITNTRY